VKLPVVSLALGAAFLAGCHVTVVQPAPPPPGPVVVQPAPVYAAPTYVEEGAVVNGVVIVAPPVIDGYILIGGEYYYWHPGFRCWVHARRGREWHPGHEVHIYHDWHEHPMYEHREHEHGHER
jgi:hypothetical protein